MERRQTESLKKVSLLSPFHYIKLKNNHITEDHEKRF